MFHQLIATICGITLQAQVNACRITLQQATVDYNVAIDQKLNKYKQDLENSEYIEPLKNKYTYSIYAIGKVVYDKQLTLTKDSLSLTFKRDGASCIWRLTF